MYLYFPKERRVKRGLGLSPLIVYVVLVCEVSRTFNFKALETWIEKLVQSQLQQARHKWGHRLNIIDWENEENSFTTDFCTPGYLAWYIRADGYATPCQLEDISLGHLLTDSFLLENSWV